jgi:hypothetical protein
LQNSNILGPGSEVVSVSEVVRVGSIVVELLVEFKIGDLHYLTSFGISLLRSDLIFDCRSDKLNVSPLYLRFLENPTFSETNPQNLEDPPKEI